MKSNFILNALCLLFLLHSKTSFAQDENPILSMDVFTQAVANNFSPDSLPVLSDSTVFDVGVDLNLYDTLNIQSIEINIGTVDGGSDIFSQLIPFDPSGSLWNGLSYNRSRYFVHLGLGRLSNLLNFYSELRIKRTDGTYSPSIKYNN